jgi:Spy/CpxP family protein refolding chaperone
MKNVLSQLTMILLLCSVAGIASAQVPNELRGPALDPPLHPMRIVAQYFDFTQEQVDQIRGFLEIRKAAVEPLLKQIAAQEKDLHDLLGTTDPDPAAVGNMLIAIHQLKEQVKAARDQFDTSLEGILTPDQATKLHAVRRAARLEPVVRAMRELGLDLP